MGELELSVVIPAHNRPERLEDTLRALLAQNLPPSNYEIIVVDDGSATPLTLTSPHGVPNCRLIRLSGLGRARARNAGAQAANGSLLVFVDDDISVVPNFLSAFKRAHNEWPEALLVGSIRLPETALRTPFGRFRQRLENEGVQTARGLTARRNFCTAANLCMPRDRFKALEGFEPGLESGEDQDLALRHTGCGGRIVFVPEATATHDDSALDIRSYCQRAGWGMEHMIPFCQRHPDWPDNVERDRALGWTRWGAEPSSQSVKKVLKSTLGLPPNLEALFLLASFLERSSPNSPLLDRVYRLLLGIHIFLGYRRGLCRYGSPGRNRYHTKVIE